MAVMMTSVRFARGSSAIGVSCALVAATLWAASTTGHASTTVCTTTGCTSGVTVRLQALRSVSGVSKTTVCVNNRCRKASRSTIRINDGSLSGERPARVTVVVYGKAGRVLLRVSKRVGLQKKEPNGEDCPPRCWSRIVILDVKNRSLIPS